MYPLALEQQYGDLFREEFAVYAEELNRKFLSIAQKYIRSNPNSDPRLDAVDQMKQNQTEVKHDVSDLLKSLFKLRDEYGDFPPRPKFESQIKRNIHQIDAWTRDKTGEVFQKQNEVMGSPPKSGVSGGDRSQFRVPAVTLPSNESPIIWERVNETINRNRKIASSAFKSHFSDVQSQIETGIRNGDSYQDLAKKISDTTDVSQARAEFWAKDQAKNFFAEQSKIRQTQAGFPGFYWKTQKDSRVRDTHSHLQDKYYTWDELPFVNRKGLGLVRTKPGEEWGCRCWAEPARGPKGTSTLAQQETTAQSIQINPVEKPNSLDLLHSKILLDLPGESFKRNIKSTISDLSSVYKIPSSLPPINVSTLAKKLADRGTMGRYIPSTGLIELNPATKVSDIIQSTFVHEFGHMVDFQLIGSPGNFGSSTSTLAPFREVVRNTFLYQNLRRGYKTGKLLRDGKEVILSPHGRNRIPYLIDETELFARAHEIWLARKLGSNELMGQIRAKAQMNFVDHYWDESDFKRIETILDQIFHEHRLLK